MKYIPTKDNFKYFKSRVVYWAKELNLDRKNIYISFDKMEPGVVASVTPLDEAYSSFSVMMNKHTIDCGDNTGEEIDTILDTTALHEVMHCALCDIEKIAYSRYVPDKKYIDSIFEDLTELLTKVIYKYHTNEKQ